MPLQEKEVKCIDACKCDLNKCSNSQNDMHHSLIERVMMKVVKMNVIDDAAFVRQLDDYD